jgi:hypothetical protein
MAEIHLISSESAAALCPDEGPAQRFVYNNLSITFFVEDVNFNRLVGDQSSGNSHINLVC